MTLSPFTIHRAKGCARTLLLVKMPLLRIITNVERKNIPDNFLEEITDVLAQAIGKPREVRLLVPSHVHIKIYILHSNLIWTNTILIIISYSGDKEDCLRSSLKIDFPIAAYSNC